MIAIDDGPAAAPAIAPSTRNATRDGPSHATTESAANTADATMPQRYRRRWPCRSPRRPAAVVTSAFARIGPEINHTKVAASTPRSLAITGRLTARIVKLIPTANAPVSTTATTSHGLRWARITWMGWRPRRGGWGTPRRSTTPPGA